MSKPTRCAHCGAVIDQEPSRSACRTCGARLAPDDVTSALLSKLSQLARFGLAAEDPPLLEPVPED